MSSSPPRLSVVLPVRNEARDLGALLARLRAQEPPPGGFEVIVVDGRSTDGTLDIVRAAARDWDALSLVVNPARRSSPARNLGADAARGEYVLYLDGHCGIPRDDLLVRVVELFEETGADCLCRPQPLEHGDGEGWAEAIRLARHAPLGHAPGSDIYADTPGFTDPESAGAAYPVELVHRLGGYDERFDACEDVEFNHRVKLAGGRAYRHPDLAVSYRPRSRPGELFRQMVRYGRGRARLAARHPETLSPVLAGLTALAAVGLVAWALGGTPVFRGLLVLAFLYLGVCVLAAYRAGVRGNLLPRVAAMFPVIHFGLLLGFWRGLPEALYFRRPPPRRRRRSPPPVGTESSRVVV